MTLSVYDGEGGSTRRSETDCAAGEVKQNSDFWRHYEAWKKTNWNIRYMKAQRTKWKHRPQLGRPCFSSTDSSSLCNVKVSREWTKISTKTRKTCFSLSQLKKLKKSPFNISFCDKIETRLLRLQQRLLIVFLRSIRTILLKLLLGSGRYLYQEAACYQALK